MRFLYRKYPAKRHETIEVEMDRPATVKFMTAGEFKNYAGGRTHTYFRGQEEDGLLRFTLPFDSIWHAVVEQPVGQEHIVANCRLRNAAPQAPLIEGRKKKTMNEDAESELQAISLGGRSEG